ncbi:aminotransferase class III-fold pyridoxal phosphate-dependent enzyme [Nonomuraea sp. NPDC046570]|uniref:aminotransferase class III-fold pyridoxal phosphate-dependent enzyme n=1 Tax=Nonomuraea sp. NPDC046570 TaxID=3155255 RepID=UPI00340144F9
MGRPGAPVLGQGDPEAGLAAVDGDCQHADQPNSGLYQNSRHQAPPVFARRAPHVRPERLGASGTPWNDLEPLTALMAAHEGQIAAVITEPALCDTGAIQPDPGYLEAVRELCDRHGATRPRDVVPFRRAHRRRHRRDRRRPARPLAGACAARSR